MRIMFGNILQQIGQGRRPLLLRQNIREQGKRLTRLCPGAALTGINGHKILVIGLLDLL